MDSLSVLNVAEKPSVAKEITNLMAQSTQTRRQSYSKFNPVMSFRYYLKNRPCNMIFTSVSGHIFRTDFPDEYRDWNKVKPESLFTAPIKREIDPNKTDLSKNLKIYAQKCQWLVLWLDCDREGEAIAYEVINICQSENPSLEIYRAIFSSVTENDIRSACANLQRPRKSLSDAVETRSELDLRIGASFTRFMSMRYRNKFELPCDLISFGPCQFPTLGFVVERYIEIEEFIPEAFWYIEVSLNKEEKGQQNIVDFNWHRDRLFNRNAVFSFFEMCVINPQALVTKISGKKKTKMRPLPLNTVEMNKLSSTFLHISAHKCMQIAENIYNKGIISYPRTETQIFSKNIEIKNLLKIQENNLIWGNYTKNLLDGKFKFPRAGTADDKAHPPIHPVKSCNRNDFNDEDEWKLYQFITKHFLAVCSDDAYGYESSVNIDIAGEQFSSNGLVILETNWLDIYEYEKWVGKKLPKFNLHEKITPNSLLMKEGKTTPPILLKESDLLEKMNQNGIGTDATMHEHIHTIEERKYVEKSSNFFQPTKLGIALVKGYKALANEVSIDLSKPALRATMESDLNNIAEGKKQKHEVTQTHISDITKIFLLIKQHIFKLDKELNKYFNIYGHSILFDGKLIKRNLIKCVYCQSLMNLMESKPSFQNSFKNDSSRNNKSRAGNSKEIKYRILICQNYNFNCKTLLHLPKHGDVSVNTINCKYCNFQTLQIYNTQKKKFHNICPNCFKNPPNVEYELSSIENISLEDGNGFRCFMCHHKTCPLSNKN